MSLISPSLFDFAQRVSLTSRFAQAQFKSVLQRQQHTQSQNLIKPQALYEQLIVGQIKLGIIDVLVLMGWRSEIWLSQAGRVAMKNWWQSVLNDHEQPVLRLIMMLRVALADSERWPGPKPVVVTMRDEMEALIQRGEWPNPQQVDVLLALVKQDAVQLAKIAMQQLLSVSALMHQVGLPIHLPIVKDAESQWLSLWLRQYQPKRTSLGLALRQLLHADLTLQHQQSLTQSILNDAHLPQSLNALKAKVASYPEVVAWLSACSRQQAFKQIFSFEELQRLRCWIGTGNYEALKGLLLQTASQHADEASMQKTENRYIFWRNYQDCFEETWLLVPAPIYHSSADIQQFTNIRVAHHTLDPIAVLKIGQYYIFQTFIGAGNPAESDLLMTADVSTVESLLESTQVSYKDIQKLDLCLIHDHKYYWQADLASTLDQSFGIVPSSALIDVAPNMQRSYRKEAQHVDFQAERSKWIKIWLYGAKNSRGHGAKERHGIDLLRQVALSAIRHGCLSSEADMQSSFDALFEASEARIQRQK